MFLKNKIYAYHYYFINVNFFNTNKKINIKINSDPITTIFKYNYMYPFQLIVYNTLT